MRGGYRNDRSLTWKEVQGPKHSRKEGIKPDSSPPSLSSWHNQSVPRLANTVTRRLKRSTRVEMDYGSVWSQLAQFGWRIRIFKSHRFSWLWPVKELSKWSNGFFMPSIWEVNILISTKTCAGTAKDIESVSSVSTTFADLIWCHSSRVPIGKNVFFETIRIRPMDDAMRGSFIAWWWKISMFTWRSTKAK